MSTASAWSSTYSLVCFACAVARNVPQAKMKMSTKTDRCDACGASVRNGDRFAFTSGGPRRSSFKGKGNGGSAPSMVSGSAPVQAPTYTPPTVQAPTVPASAAPVDASMDLDLVLRIARKAASDAANAAVAPIADRVVALESKPTIDHPFTVVHVHPTPAELDAAEGPAAPTVIGPVHKDFAQALTFARAALREGMHLVICGRAGWGKTHHVRLMAQAIGAPIRIQGAIGDRSMDLLGYKDPHGNYVPTEFYNSCKAAEAPGSVAIHCFDELDASTDAAAPLAINAILSSNLSPFPCGTFKRSGRLLAIGLTNTNLDGATAAYSGRIRFDRAFKNRFYVMTWGEDPALESALFPETAARVQDLRARCNDRGIETDGTVTMRESAKIRGLMREGMDLATAERIVFSASIGADNYAAIL